MPNPWQEMAAMTEAICTSGKNECARFKDRPYRCCHRFFCEAAKKFALSKGVKLQPTGNPEVPFMGVNGCVVPPELRPNCTLHVCTISYADKSHIEHDEAKTKAYLELRKKLGV